MESIEELRKKSIYVPSFLEKAVKHLALQCTQFFSFVFFPIIVLLRLLRFRFVSLPENIGAVSLIPASFVREKKLGLKIVLCAPFGALHTKERFVSQAVNSYLYQVWKQHFFVIDNSLLSWFLKPISTAPLLQLSYYDYFAGSPDRTFYAVNQRAEKGPLLKLSPKEIEHGYATLEKSGIPKNSWFVCFFAREPGYYLSIDLPTQGVIRNVRVETYEKALLEIGKRGGYVIRMGSPKASPLPKPLANHPQIIDYPQSALHSDFMDIFLLSQCRFMLTCASGISMVPGLFDVPIVMTNVIPMHIAKPLYTHDLTLMKRYYSRIFERELSFFEAFSLFTQNQIFAHYYQELGLEILDNSEEEIYEAVCEMFDRLEGTYRETEEEREMEQRFERAIPEHLLCKSGCGRVCSSFLKRHKQLLQHQVESGVTFR